MQQNLIKITNEKKVNLTEEYLGKYSAKRLDIYVGSEIISLIPRGTLIMGSNGRIDMRGPKGEIMALEPEWNRWEFVNPAPTIKTWEMNEDSFKDMIQFLM